jgi:hypothetical protein
MMMILPKLLLGSLWAIGFLMAETVFAKDETDAWPSPPLTNRANAKWETLVDGGSFNSSSLFQSKWNYNYPWGTDHNGSARMNATNVTVSGGVVTLASSPTNINEGSSSASPYLTIRYNSGTFYLKQQIIVNSQYPIWDISGQFKVPTQTGCWPAFWMTGAKTWPPESDFMEFKGSAGCNQNTYDGSWQGRITTVSTASSTWHSYRIVACLKNSTDVDFHYFIDGIMESEQTSTTFVGSPCWLIIDYQTEGSSGSPGPIATTYAYVTNVIVKRLNTTGVGVEPLANRAYQILARGSRDSLSVSDQNIANNSTLNNVTHLGNNQYCILGGKADAPCKWRIAIAGQTGSTLTIPSAQGSDIANYN